MQEAIITFSTLFFLMFFYSGITKITSFEEKVNTLNKKLDSILPFLIPKYLINIAMVYVILLEIIGPIIIISRLILGDKSPKLLKQLSDAVFIHFILFLIIVTPLYHPFSWDKPIPFLSNLTTLSGIVLMFIISNKIDLYNNILTKN